MGRRQSVAIARIEKKVREELGDQVEVGLRADGSQFVADIPDQVFQGRKVVSCEISDDRAMAVVRKITAKFIPPKK